MKRCLNDPSCVSVIDPIGGRREPPRQLIMAVAMAVSLATSYLAGCVYTYKPLDKATASKVLIAAENGCKGDLVKVWDKKGKPLVDKDGLENFAVCAVTDTWFEPCCSVEGKGFYNRCAKPERLKFSEMSRIELLYPKVTSKSRCFYASSFSLSGFRF